MKEKKGETLYSDWELRNTIRGLTMKIGRLGARRAAALIKKEKRKNLGRRRLLRYASIRGRNLGLEGQSRKRSEKIAKGNL